MVTNKTPNAPYRGAGRPETVFAMDRIVDCLARELSMDPADLRRRNYLSATDLPYEIDLPYRDGNRLVYDSGDFKAGLEAALAAAGYDALRAEQKELRAQSVYRGIGLSGYVEGTAIGPYEGAIGEARRRGTRGGGHGGLQPGAGARDVLCPDRRRCPRHSSRLGHRGGRGHRGHSLRGGHLRLAERGERGQLHSRGGGPGARQARGGGGRAARGGARRYRDRRRRRLRARGARHGDSHPVASSRPPFPPSRSPVSPRQTSRRPSTTTSRR